MAAAGTDSTGDTAGYHPVARELSLTEGAAGGDLGTDSARAL